YLGIKDNKNIQLVLPEHLYDFDVDLNVALEQARINRPEILQYEREKLQAQKELKKAKANSGLNADLVVEYGLESQPEELYEAFNNVGSKQQLNVRMSIPILDWGRAKSQKNKALANLELVEYNTEQDLINFEQEIITHVNSFIQSKNQVKLAKRADEIGRKRYEVAKNRYMIGNISITDINIASQEKDAAKKSYIQALNNYWMAYYKLRKLTLYDFRFNQLIYEL
ncbi:MAG: TolC family protein, partial [Bacteroidales bacterium]|nr:TolC family protein [Bacteroidales bacterium]